MPEPRTHLIWSLSGCWHRRAEDGAAAGYTTDIAEAGHFEASMAKLYDDGKKDRAVPLSEAAEALRKRLLVVEATRDCLLETLNALEVA